MYIFCIFHLGSRTDWLKELPISVSSWAKTEYQVAKDIWTPGEFSFSRNAEHIINQHTSLSSCRLYEYHLKHGGQFLPPQTHSFTRLFVFIILNQNHMQSHAT